MAWGLHGNGNTNYTQEKVGFRPLKDQGSHSRQETAKARAKFLFNVFFYQPLKGSKSEMIQIGISLIKGQ